MRKALLLFNFYSGNKPINNKQGTSKPVKANCPPIFYKRYGENWTPKLEASNSEVWNTSGDALLLWHNGNLQFKGAF